MEEKDKEKKLALQKAVGERVYRQRNAVGMSREKLAEHLGITPQYVNEIEQGKKCMSMALFVELGHVFCVGLDELAHGREPEDPTLERLIRHWKELSPLDREMAAHLLHKAFDMIQQMGRED